MQKNSIIDVFQGPYYVSFYFNFQLSKEFQKK